MSKKMIAVTVAAVVTPVLGYDTTMDYNSTEVELEHAYNWLVENCKQGRDVFLNNAKSMDIEEDVAKKFFNSKRQKEVEGLWRVIGKPDLPKAKWLKLVRDREFDVDRAEKLFALKQPKRDEQLKTLRVAKENKRKKIDKKYVGPSPDDYCHIKRDYSLWKPKEWMKQDSPLCKSKQNAQRQHKNKMYRDGERENQVTSIVLSTARNCRSTNAKKEGEDENLKEQYQQGQKLMKNDPNYLKIVRASAKLEKCELPEEKDFREYKRMYHKLLKLCKKTWFSDDEDPKQTLNVAYQELQKLWQTRYENLEKAIAKNNGPLKFAQKYFLEFDEGEAKQTQLFDEERLAKEKEEREKTELQEFEERERNAHNVNKQRELREQQKTQKLASEDDDGIRLRCVWWDDKGLSPCSGRFTHCMRDAEFGTTIYMCAAHFKEHEADVLSVNEESSQNNGPQWVPCSPKQRV